MKKLMLNAAILAGAIFIATSCSDRRAENKDSEEIAKEENDKKFDDTAVEGDTKFAVDAADGGLLEVQLGELAQTKGVAQEVKDLGKMLATEHMKANEELKVIADQKSISLPETLSEDCQKTYDDLAAKSGTEFDEAFAKHMVKDHQDDIDDFKKEAENGDDPDLKAWAAGKITALEQHLAMARQTEQAVDNQKTGKLDR